MSTTATPEQIPEKRTEKRVYRFDEFCADPLRRVLLRDGEVVPVTPKAISILLVLLEKQGEVVPKEELIRQVWSSSYVSDANLMQNVSSLRKALGDRTEGRRYVVTVPGQGYCFAAPVSAGEAAADAKVQETAETLEDSGFWSFPDPGSHSSSGTFPILFEVEKTGPVPAAVRPVRQGLVRIGLGLACLAALVALSLYISRLDRGPLALPDDLGSFAQIRRTSVAVLGFRDLSGKPETRWLGSAVSEMLTTELSAGARVRVVSRENLARARQSLDIPESGSFDEATLERLRSILGSDLLVTGSYLVLDEGGERRIRLDVRVLEVPGGDIVASLAEVGKESGLFELVSRTGNRLRQRLGLDGITARQARATRALQPADPGAMELYSRGLERLHANDAPRALELFEDAVEADPRSAVIRSALSEAYGQLGYDDRALEEQKRAVALAAALPREQRLGIQARLHELSREWGRASEIYRSLWTFYPDNLEYGLKLANCLMRGGRPPEARETIAALRRLPPPEGEDVRIDMMESRVAHRLSDLAAQLRSADSAIAKGRRSGETLILAQALVFKGDAVMTMGALDEAVGIFRESRDLAAKENNPMILGMAYSNLGLALQSRGDLDEAEAAHRESLDIARRIGSAVGIAAQLEVLGDLYRSRGELAKAQSFLERSLSAYAGLGDLTLQGRVRSGIGLTRWARGDLAGARSALDQALALSRQTGDRNTEAVTLSHLGRVLDRQGDLQGALRQHEQAFARLRLNDPGRAAGALAQSAGVLVQLGELERARRHFEQALQTRRRRGDRIGIADTLGAMADLQYRKGDLAASRRLASREAEIAGGIGARLLLAGALRRMGRVDWAEGRFPESRRSLERALETLGFGPGKSVEDSLEKHDLHLDLARLAISERRFEEAARLAGGEVVWCRDRGMTGSTGGEAEAQSLLADAREALSGRRSASPVGPPPARRATPAPPRR